MEMTNDFTGMGDVQPVSAPKRPTFLTVICIFSFIGCGLSLVMGLWGLVQNTPEHMQESIEQVRQFDQAMADQMETQQQLMQESSYMQVAPYLNFVYLLISFLGVLMMWKRNKKGFFVYLAGELIPYVLMAIMWKESAMMMGGAGGGMGAMIFKVTMALMVIGDLAFIGMYSANLKHMK